MKYFVNKFIILHSSDKAIKAASKNSRTSAVSQSFIRSSRESLVVIRGRLRLPFVRSSVLDKTQVKFNYFKEGLTMLTDI